MERRKSIGEMSTAELADLLAQVRAGDSDAWGDLETLPLEHPDPSQLEQLQIDHDSKHVRAGLAKLPDRARMALVLRYYSEMSYDEIADTLGVRRAFVGVLLLR